MPSPSREVHTQPKFVSSSFFTASQLKLLASPAPLVFEVPQADGIFEAVVYTRSSAGLHSLINPARRTVLAVIEPDPLALRAPSRFIRARSTSFTLTRTPMENPSSIIDEHYELAPSTPTSSTRSSTPESFYLDTAGPYAYDHAARSPSPIRPSSPPHDVGSPPYIPLPSPLLRPSTVNPDFINYSIPDLARDLAHNLSAEHAAAALEADDLMSDSDSDSDSSTIANYSPTGLSDSRPLPSISGAQETRVMSSIYDIIDHDDDDVRSPPAPPYSLPPVNFFTTAAPRFVSPHAPVHPSPLSAPPVTADDARPSSARGLHPFTPIRTRHAEHCCDPCRERLEAIDHRYAELQRLVFNLSEFVRFRVNHLDTLVTDALEGQEHMHDDIRYTRHVTEHTLSEVRELAGLPPLDLEPPSYRD